MGVEVPSNPINRKEQYLAKIAGQTVEIPAEPLTREEAYLDYIAKHGGGGGGGTNDYDDLLNQPKINNVTLKGNKSAEDLGLARKTDVKKEFGGTLEEWNALTTEQKKEYDTYDITDDYSDGNYIYLPTIYSEEERQVGVWKDGKPLYQKTIILSSVSYDTNWHDISHGISNIDSIKYVNGAVKNAESGSAEEFYDLSVYRPNSQTGIVVGATKTNVTYINNWLESATELWVTLQYTKTTDTAGSGTWTPTGQYAEHYSTDEQVIGTWIDGKTLYRKVYSNLPLTDSTDFTVESNFSSTKNLVSVFAMGYAEGVGVKQAVPLSDFVSAGSLYAYPRILNNNLTMIINGDMSDFTANIIVEYTKTA